MLRRAATLAWRVTYARYLMASVVALGVDMACFMGLIHAGRMGAVSAAMTGYGAGLLVHWLLSSRLVFALADDQRAGTRARRKLLFVGSAFVGLAITMAIVGLGQALGLAPWIAKGAAVAMSFQATYFLRRSVVFA